MATRYNKSEEKKQHEEILGHFGQWVSTFDNDRELRLPQLAYQILRNAIRNLILPPGTTILEREISEILEMSRTPVREALIRLETEDSVEIIPRRGFIVEPIKKNDLAEIYQIVESLDGMAIELAANRIKEEDLVRLEEEIQKQELAVEKNDLNHWAILDDQFHDMIIQFAGNANLNAVIDTFSDKLYRARLYTIQNRPIPSRSIVEHQAMIACLHASDGRAARFVMQSHRSRAVQEIIQALETIEGKEN